MITVEIRAAEGGDDSKDLVNEMLKLYTIGQKRYSY